MSATLWVSSRKGFPRPETRGSICQHPWHFWCLMPCCVFVEFVQPCVFPVALNHGRCLWILYIGPFILLYLLRMNNSCATVPPMNAMKYVNSGSSVVLGFRVGRLLWMLSRLSPWSVRSVGKLWSFFLKYKSMHKSMAHMLSTFISSFSLIARGCKIHRVTEQRRAGFYFGTTGGWNITFTLLCQSSSYELLNFFV